MLSMIISITTIVPVRPIPALDTFTEETEGIYVSSVTTTYRLIKDEHHKTTNLCEAVLNEACVYVPILS